MKTQTSFFGSVVDANIGDEVRITVIATGFEKTKAAQTNLPKGAQPGVGYRYAPQGQITRDYAPVHPSLQGMREVVVGGTHGGASHEEDVPIHVDSSEPMHDSGAHGSGPTQIHPSQSQVCLLYTSPSPRDATLSRMPSSA